MIIEENKINLVMKESLVEKANENKIFSNIDKESVYFSLKKYGFTKSELDKIFFAESYTTSEQQKLNQVFRDITKKDGVPLMDIVLFLEEDYDKLKKILSFMDGDTKSILKNQMSKTYGIEVDSNKLYKILG